VGSVTRRTKKKKKKKKCIYSIAITMALIRMTAKWKKQNFRVIPRTEDGVGGQIDTDRAITIMTMIAMTIDIHHRTSFLMNISIVTVTEEFHMWRAVMVMKR
jgi:hypothetical protein